MAYLVRHEESIRDTERNRTGCDSNTHHTSATRALDRRGTLSLPKCRAANRAALEAHKGTAIYSRHVENYPLQKRRH